MSGDLDSSHCSCGLCSDLVSWFLGGVHILFVGFSSVQILFVRIIYGFHCDNCVCRSVRKYIASLHGLHLRLRLLNMVWL